MRVCQEIITHNSVEDGILYNAYIYVLPMFLLSFMAQVIMFYSVELIVWKLFLSF